MKPFLLIIIFSVIRIFETSANENTVVQALCDADGLQLEISKAIDILKKLEEKSIKGIPPTPNRPRQDDDEDEGLPYYVPAIAKVVGSVLAQNATNIIEESFGFIPPEINQNIRYVLGLVAETVAKLRPTPAPTEPPPTFAPVKKFPSIVPQKVNASSTEKPEPVADLESLLAFALAQQFLQNVNNNNNNTSTTEASYNVSINLETEANDAVIATTSTSTSSAPIIKLTTPTTPELFTTTFKYSDGKSVSSENGLIAADELPVYASAYAPNYGVRTTTSAIYAPAFDYNTYTTPSPPTKKSPALISVTSSKTTTVKTSTSSTTTSTTTDYDITTDDDDERINSEDLTSTTSNNILTSKGNGSSSVISTTTEDEDEDYDSRSFGLNGLNKIKRVE